MPRLSLYKPEKGPDFRFLDRAINEQFQVGGTDIFVHKYLGPVNPAEGTATPGVPTNSNPIPELGIQDLIFMENRDRHYDADIYQLRGIYTMQDIDFNLSQFGLFLTNDNIMITLHLRSTFDALGRKIMNGDVLELPHLKDEYALDDAMIALKRFYVVTDVTRAATGFSQTWYPHLLRVKCQPIVDSQEFKEIFDAMSGAEDGSTLRDLMSTYKKNIEINDSIIAQAEADAPLSGYDSTSFYVIPTRADGTVDVQDTSDTNITSDQWAEETIPIDASVVLRTPDTDLYIGTTSGDGIPPNGAPFTSGITFPSNPILGQFHLRNDFFPQRLFRYDGANWVKFEDKVRMELTGKPADGKPTDAPLTRQNQKSSFINNNNTATVAGEVIKERQALSKALRPKADN
jgi:hypothetical protein